MGLVLVVAVWSTSDAQRPLWTRDVGNLLAIHGTAAAEAYERTGGPGLQDYLARSEPDATLRTFLFDENADEVTRRDAPEQVRDLAASARTSSRVEFGRGLPSLVVARPVVAPSGRAFVVVAQFAGGRREPPPLPTWLLVRGLAVLVTAGIVCYALAWYLTRRLDRLRAATRALAGGDLSVRVGSSLGGRDDLTDLGHDVDEMAERLEAFFASERRLLQDVSHELRSPLARLGVALELLRKRAGPDAAREIDRIELEAARLDSMIGRILSLTRLEKAAVDVGSFVEVDLSALVADIAADATFEASNSDRRVDVVSSDACVVRGDSALLRSAIENVVRNAVRYTAENTAVDVMLRTETQPEATGRVAVLTVRDRGPGVPQEALDQLFRPFYRVDDGRDRASGGTGLGLAITDRAVQLHGGSVTASNATDGGLVIEIRLPA